MLVFSTKLYVKDTLTNDLFIDKVIEWVKKSPNYTFDEFSWDKSDDLFVSSKDGLQELTINKYETSILAHLVNKDGKVIWTNDYVLTYKNGKRILAVQLYSDAEDMSVKLPTDFNRPHLLKTILRDGFGDVDLDLDTNDKAIVVNPSNVDIIKKIILNEQQYMMPIVYITPFLYTGNYNIDYHELAKDLAGVAHVIVEENVDTTKLLKDLTKGKNPYNGAVQLYFGNGFSRRILPNVFRNSNAFRKEVANSVFRKLILSKIDDDLLWSKIRLSKAIEFNIKNNKDNDELFELYDEEIKSKEKDIAVRDNRIQELEEKVSRCDAKIVHLQQRLEQKCAEEGCNTTTLIFSQECDFYQDEQKDIIIKVLDKEVKSMESDQNQKESRKFHVLKSIVEQNELANSSKDIVTDIRRTFSGDFTLNNGTKKRVNDLGFTVEEGKHYKLIFMDDPRYIFTVAKTSSDGSRVNKNLRSEILKKLFGTDV